MRLIDADELEFVYATLPKDASEEYKEGYGDGMNYVLDIIDDLPTIEPVKWIPISEGTPKANGRYLVSGKWGSGKESVGDCEFSVEDGYFQTAWNFDVLAWMPLPLAYQESKDESGI